MRSISTQGKYIGHIELINEK